MTVYGYARVSTFEQNLDLQVATLRHECDEVHAETASGVARVRPCLNALLDTLADGDELVVTKLDRLGRSVQDLSALYTKLTAAGVKLRSLGEPYINDAALGKLMFNLLVTFAEFERDRMVERTKEGMELARKRGKLIGKPFKLSQEEVANMQTLRERGASINNLARQFKIARSTVYEYLNMTHEDRARKLKKK